jgi:phospholipid transport system substrate-binding protein
VKTWVTGANQPDFEIDYKLLLNGGGWKVYDVVIEGISLVGNYRQQFGSILNSESFESLLQRLREKATAH